MKTAFRYRHSLSNCTGLVAVYLKAGRAAAKARGVKRGLKPLLSAPKIAHARKLREQGKAQAT